MPRPLSEELRGWLATGADLLLPPACALCRRDLDAWRSFPAGSGDRCGFCAVCVEALSCRGERCRRCGAPATARGCTACASRRPDHDGIVVLGGYEGALRDAVLRAKRPAGQDLSAGLAALLVARHRDTIAGWDVDVVVPVPMHWWRRLVRGVNAAEVVARALARLTGLRADSLLRRRRATVRQNRLPHDSRRGNVRGAFAARAGSVGGRRVLLVDDVVTTGGTVAECRRVLADAGAAAVHVAAIARADRGGDDGEE